VVNFAHLLPQNFNLILSAKRFVADMASEIDLVKSSPAQ